MALKLYVDSLSDDGKIGMATNKQMILRNTTILKMHQKEHANQSPVIFQAGRYLCCMMTSTQNQLAMFFMDFKNDKRQALFASKQYVNRYTRKIFMEVFHKVSERYEENYNEVELVLDNNFIPDIVES